MDTPRIPPINMPVQFYRAGLVDGAPVIQEIAGHGEMDAKDWRNFEVAPRHMAGMPLQRFIADTTRDFEGCTPSPAMTLQSQLEFFAPYGLPEQDPDDWVGSSQFIPAGCAPNKAQYAVIFVRTRLAILADRADFVARGGTPDWEIIPDQGISRLADTWQLDKRYRAALTAAEEVQS